MGVWLEKPVAERLIKKYTNRRLYDPASSRHVTLQDIRELIVAGDTVRVLDEKTGEDLTRSILLQIVSEQEQHGAPILTPALLTQLIRLYGNPMQAAMARFLESSVSQFGAQQRQFLEQLSGKTADADLAGMVKNNLDSWLGMQESFLNMLASMTPDKDKRRDR